MEKYQYKGPKEQGVKVYQTLAFVESLIAEYTFESLSLYNFGFAIIYKWIKYAIEARRRDISMRTLNARNKKEERAGKQEEEALRLEARKTALEEADEAF